MEAQKAILGKSDIIENVLDEIYEKSTVNYVILSYIYRFGFTRDEILNCIEEKRLPETYKNGTPLPELDSKLKEAVKNLNTVNTKGTLRKNVGMALSKASKDYHIDGLTTLALRKTWAYNELKNGTDISFIRTQLSYKNGMINFIKYLGISRDELLREPELINIYCKSLLLQLEHRVDKGRLETGFVEALEKLTH